MTRVVKYGIPYLNWSLIKQREELVTGGIIVGN